MLERDPEKRTGKKKASNLYLVGELPSNKAKYSALDASRRRLREGVTDLRTDGRTDRPSYRDAMTHLKTKRHSGSSPSRSSISSSYHLY